MSILNTPIPSTHPPIPTASAPALAESLNLTAEAFVKQWEKKRAELIQGIVKELPMPFAKHGYVCLEIGSLIRNHVKANDLGRVMSNDSFVQTRTQPDTVRGPDICYYSFERLPRGEIPEGLLTTAPDLVVEVRSPSDGWNEMFIKVGEYLSAGVRAVVILDAATTTASVYRSERLQQTFEADHELTIPEVLPNFAVTVRKLFE